MVHQVGFTQVFTVCTMWCYCTSFVFVGGHSAFVDHLAVPTTLRHNNCLLLVPYDKQGSRCSECISHRLTLTVQVGRMQNPANSETTPSSHTNLRYVWWINVCKGKVSSTPFCMTDLNLFQLLWIDSSSYEKSTTPWRNSIIGWRIRLWRQLKPVG